MFWYLLLICKGSLTSSIYIDSCWVYIILKWLIFLWYVIHVCSKSFTSPFIRCILCFMWLEFSHLFLYKCMYVRGVNFTSLFFMNVYSIYTFIVLIYAKRKKNIIYALYCLYPFVDELTKRGRDILEFYMHMCLNLLSFYHCHQKHLLLELVSRASFVVLLVSRVFVGIKSNNFLRTCIF